jgi:hypothetical protein
MIVETEPNGLMMVRYKLYFNQQTPDPEDAWVLAYFQEHGLEPRRELWEEHEGVTYKLLHFGQCYLARHVGALGELYQRGIEHTVLAQHLRTLLTETNDAALRAATAALDDAARKALAAQAATQLHPQTKFETTEDRNLRVILDDAVACEALLSVRTT